MNLFKFLSLIIVLNFTAQASFITLPVTSLPVMRKIDFDLNNIDKAIYGSLDVRPVNASLKTPIGKKAHATALLVNRFSLNEVVEDKLFELTGVNFAKEARLCEGENDFLRQTQFGKCSAVLVGPKQLLTAAHCIRNIQLDCDRKSFIFDARQDLGTDKRTQYFVKSQVYHCSKILAYNQSRDDTFDYALIELDRNVTGGREPVEVKKDELQNGDEVYMLGHPNGFLAQYSSNGFVRSDDDLFYNTNLDAFGGNSGGPVFDKSTNELVGLLIRGHDDLKWDTEAQCNRVVYCEEDECDGESVLKIGRIIDDIQKARNN